MQKAVALGSPSTPRRQHFCQDEPAEVGECWIMLCKGSVQRVLLLYLEGCIVAGVQLYEGVDFINGVAQLEVGIIRRNLQLCDESVHLADEQADRETLLACLLDGLLSHQHDTLYCIDYQQDAICQPHCCRDLVIEVDVACKGRQCVFLAPAQAPWA